MSLSNHYVRENILEMSIRNKQEINKALDLPEMSMTKLGLEVHLRNFTTNYFLYVFTNV